MFKYNIRNITTLLVQFKSLSETFYNNKTCFKIFERNNQSWYYLQKTKYIKIISRILVEWDRVLRCELRKKSELSKIYYRFCYLIERCDYVGRNNRNDYLWLCYYMYIKTDACASRYNATYHITYISESFISLNRLWISCELSLLIFFNRITKSQVLNLLRDIKFLKESSSRCLSKQVIKS